MSAFGVPQLPSPGTPVINKDGSMTQYWHEFHKNFTQYVQTNLNQEGYQLPLVTNADLSVLTSQRNLGKIVFNTDTNTMYIGVNT